jgi:2-haloacid dehalogenase
MSTRPNAIRAVVFDAYGTLFNVHSVAQTCETLFPGKGSALSQLWRSKQLEYSWLRSLMGRYVDFNQVTRESLQFACESLRLPFSDLAATKLNDAYRQLAMFDDTFPVLRHLQQHHPTAKRAILSNGAPEMLNAVVSHNNNSVLFDAVISVDAISVFKPDLRVYQLCSDQLGVVPGEVAFVSSNGWDAAGAKAFGFTTFWINRSSAPVEQLGVTPDQVLNSLAELPAHLG